MPRNEPSASNTSAQLSVRCDAELKERYKDALDAEGRTMSEDLRRHMEQVVAEHGGAVSNPGHLPDDDELATAYTRLDDLADPDTRTISADAAESALADALNRPKTTVRRAVLGPLERRGYITPRWGDLRVTRPSDLVDIDAGAAAHAD
jgi:antitoxin component of RelBE/YafQ-DinJ toxin-antitoxin module